MKSIMPIPDGWRLTYEEVSNNTYCVQLTSQHGPSITLTGVDVDELITQCVAWATDVQQQLNLT
jgi:hypothetical protein